MLKLTLEAIFFVGLIAVVQGAQLEKLQTVQATKSYHVFTEARSFIGALIGCRASGLELATIESETEQYEVNNATLDAEYTDANGYWIGAAAEYYGTNAWYWINTGYKIIYTNWGSGQPKYSSYYPETGSCVRLGSFFKENEPYKWENVNCNAELYYVCESATE